MSKYSITSQIHMLRNIENNTSENQCRCRVSLDIPIITGYKIQVLQYFGSLRERYMAKIPARRVWAEGNDRVAKFSVLNGGESILKSGLGTFVKIFKIITTTSPSKKDTMKITVSKVIFFLDELSAMIATIMYIRKAIKLAV